MSDIAAALERLDRSARSTVEKIAHRVDAGTKSFSGRLREASGPVLVADVPGGAIGHVCRLLDPEHGRIGEAEIVGFRGSSTLLAPFGSPVGLSQRVEVLSTGAPALFRASGESLGCVVDWRGETVTRFANSTREAGAEWRPLGKAPPDLHERRGISRVLPTGVRAIDGLLTFGEGQRIGLFGNAGLGKSTCVEMILNGADVDVAIVGLIGERGREVAEFIERLSGVENAGRICVVAATSDRPAVERLNAAMTATGLAEYFRDAGLRVLLIVDSLTRVARAARDLGLARGEPPTRRGFPPSVFDFLPPLLERAGATRHGSITAVYCVLVEGELTDDPVAEEAKSLLDGHLVLSAKIAAEGIYPAIDLSESRSRSMRTIVTEGHAAAADQFRELSAAFENISLLLKVGEYREGHDETADRSLVARDAMRAFLLQSPGTRSDMDETLAELERICA